MQCTVSQMEYFRKYKITCLYIKSTKTDGATLVLVLRSNTLFIDQTFTNT